MKSVSHTMGERKKIGWKDGFRAIYCIVKYNIFRGNNYGHLTKTAELR
jgi:hypothetical protein